jgi:hypothetical protein
MLCLWCLQFPATAVNDAASASVILRNSSSSTSQLFEFGVPAGSWLQVRFDIVIFYILLFYHQLLHQSLRL